MFRVGTSGAGLCALRRFFCFGEDMLPPTDDSLKAMAGWAISCKRDAAPHQEVALGKFQDGCEALVGNLPRPPASHPSPQMEQSPPPRERNPLERIPEFRCQGSVPAPAGIDPEFWVEVHRPSLTSDSCPHQFSITTQKCISCGRTYREIKAQRGK